MTDIEYRRANVSDARRLATIGIAALQQAYSAIDQDDPQFDDAAHMLVATEDSRIIGYVSSKTGDNHISDLWVVPDRQGLGIGGELLVRMEQDIRARGFADLHLEVLTSNTRAIGLFKYRGYKVMKQGMKMDALQAVPLHMTELRKTLVGA